MSIQLFKLTAYPDDFAVSKVGSWVEGGAFFLDFSRPLEVRRWFGFRNRWIGVAVGLFVPVVHEGEENGGYMIAVLRDDPYFFDIRAMWETHYPSKRGLPPAKAEGFKIIADFAKQFPEDC